MTSEVHLRDEFASAGSLSGVFKPYQILYIAILIKSISFNHALTADLPFHAISAWENEPSLSTNCVSGIPLTMLIIREWDCQEGHNLLFNCHYDPSVLWDILGKLDSTQPGLHKINKIIYTSRLEQVTIQTFRNTRTILQYIYFTYEVKFKHFYLLLKT